MNPVDVTVCKTKIDIAEQLLREVLRELSDTDMSRDAYGSLTQDFIAAISHIRKAVENQ